MDKHQSDGIMGNAIECKLNENDEGEENGVCVIEARNFSFAAPGLTGSINSNAKYGIK